MTKTGRDRLLPGVLAVGVVACLLYAGAGFLLAPRLIEHRLAALVEERLGETFSVDKLRVNPFALSVEATGVRLGQKNGSPLLAARRVYLNLSFLGSGFGRGWVLSEAQTEGLQVQLESQRNGRLNFADLAQRWQRGSPPAKPGDAPVRVTIRHLLASDGELTYRELSDRPAATRVMPIRLELANVSTLPDREGRYTVSARFVDGGTLTWRGDISLPLKSEGDVALEGLKLATIWKFIRDDVRIAEPEGALSVATHYKFTYADGKPELGLTALRLSASALRVVREGFDEPILSMKSLDVSDGNFQLGRRALVLPVVSLSEGAVNVVKDAGGTWNWTGFAREKHSTAHATQPARSPGGGQQVARAWRIDMNAVKVDNVALRYEDRHRPRPLQMDTSAMHGAAVVEVIAGGDSPGVLAHGMNLRLENVRLPAADTPARLTALRVEGGFVDLSKHALGATRLAIDGGTLLVERGSDGAFPIAASFAGGADTPPAPSPWTYAVGSVRVKGLDVAFSDLGFGKQPVKVQFAGLAATIDNIALPGGKPMAFNASAGIGSGGSIAANGSAAADLSRVDAKVKLSELTLSALQPFIARYAAVQLASGSASASAVLAYRRTGHKPALSLSGPFELANVRLNEAGSDQTVLAWERLAAGEAHLTLAPDRVSIDQIVVEAPEAKIDISEQRELNILQLFRREPASASQSAQPANGDAKESQFPVHIGEVRVRDGTMDFSDRSLALPFSTKVTNLNGTAAGLGTNREHPSVLQFEGKIGESGSAKIDGRIDPASPKTFTEIDVAFQNVDFPDLSPYSVTFLGRKIASGRLWVNLKYGIANSQLTGANDITIHDLKLGERVESPTALRLPLDLAVALLTDSEGVIRAAVPIRGNLNSPQFDFGAVIREALSSVILKIVSAPFRALAGLFGREGGGKDVGSIEFEHGSATLLPSEKEKLRKVAKAMSERPQLKLVVQAPYALESDGAAMKQEKARREVALALGRSLEPGEKPAPVVFENLATQRALERLLARKAQPRVARELVARHASRTGEAPKRASLWLRHAGDPEFYKAVYAWLAESEPVSEETIENLAASRANAVLEALRSAGADPARLEPGPVEESKHEKGQHISVELSLEAAGDARATASAEPPAIAQVSR